jgi:hypothetical protein
VDRPPQAGLSAVARASERRRKPQAHNIADCGLQTADCNADCGSLIDCGLDERLWGMPPQSTLLNPQWTSRNRQSAFANPQSRFPGGHRRGVTPVPIPNTEVKLSTADGTARVTAWESRSLPGLFFQGPLRVKRAFFCTDRVRLLGAAPREGLRPRRGAATGRRWQSSATF